VILAPPRTYPIQRAEAELGLRTLGPPWPPPLFGADEWLARFALEHFLRARVLRPLGMVDTGFSVPEDAQARLTTAYEPDEVGALTVLDPPTGGWWNAPPAMADAAGMLVSTVDDLWAFVAMLLAGGSYGGEQILSPASVAAMTTDHLTPEQRAAAAFLLGEHEGWGYGMAAPRSPEGEPPVPWGFGSDGGTGTTWRSDPVRGLTGILLTQRVLTSPEAPPLFTNFWEAAYAAMT
jgi:CubicO group peptidase (beta-lactamase class C family)